MLTVWEQLQLHASEQVEVLEVGQLPEAFGEQTGEQLVRFLKMEYNGATQVQTGTGATYSQEGTPTFASPPC